MSQNRLAGESSPYLLQHASNPVDWQPWGVEALKMAQNEDRPILVSIGYSTCHWCHVMEHESFENHEVAELMNTNYVCIKIDREERPDLDQIYMDSVQQMGVHGGWPLNVFLTPDQKPFYGGTYFPREQWMALLSNVSAAYKDQRAKVYDSAEMLTKSIQEQSLEATNNQNLDFNELVKNLVAKSDHAEGGLVGTQKFPMPAIWKFGLNSGNSELENISVFTLRKMALGGIYDQIEGGFFRYSVDPLWFAPHFEKMLYDNAQLISVFSRAFRFTNSPLFKDVVHETIVWLQDNMVSPKGFFSAIDADSEGEEGKFYTWTQDELEKILIEKSLYFSDIWNTSAGGNWENGRNILALAEDRPENSEYKEYSLLLQKERSKRVFPSIDTKVIVGWNAMTICGLLDAYDCLTNPLYLKLARSGSEQLLEHGLEGQNKVFRIIGSSTEGFLEDYAWIIRAFYKMYQVTFEPKWALKAIGLLEEVLNQFDDSMSPNLFFTSATSESLIARKKEIHDNVIPASNSVMAHNLFDLGILFSNSNWKKRAQDMLSSVSNNLEKHPSYFANWAELWIRKNINPVIEVAITGDNDLEIRNEIARKHGDSVVFAGGKLDIPLLQNRHSPKGRSTIYVCQNSVCHLPVHTMNAALDQIKNIG